MWTQKRIEQYIADSVEESTHLDYKAADALAKSDGKKNEIAKDVSSFANSDGGIIIYGIKEYELDTRFLPEKIDAVDRNAFSKETLEQIINSRIAPRLHGVKITPVTIGDPNDNAVVYVVEIPKSDTAHQASDKKYYRRFNFQSIAMDDWEIKDIINRKNKSQIIIGLRPRFSLQAYEGYIKHTGIKMVFDIIATNSGNKVVEYVDCMIVGNEAASKEISPAPPIERGYFELYYTNEEEYKINLKGDDYVVNSRRHAILPSTYRVIGKITFFSDFFKDNHKIGITVTMDDNRIFLKRDAKEFVDLT